MTRAAIDRVVLDTNACLDLWVFNDPRAQALRTALADGTLQAISDAACRDEWCRVLDYPQLRLDVSAQRVLADTYDAVMTCAAGAIAPRRGKPPLPRCADPDDQKFLQLALDGGARWLVSRDNDLLVLGRRTRRDGLFDIVSPLAWRGHTA